MRLDALLFPVCVPSPTEGYGRPMPYSPPIPDGPAPRLVSVTNRISFDMPGSAQVAVAQRADRRFPR